MLSASSLPNGSGSQATSIPYSLSTELPRYIPGLLSAGIAEILQRTAIGRTGRGDSTGAQRPQDDADDERGGGKLAVPDRGARAHRLQRDVHRAGQPGGIGRLDDLVVRGPQGQPGR